MDPHQNARISIRVLQKMRVFAKFGFAKSNCARTVNEKKRVLSDLRKAGPLTGRKTALSDLRKAGSLTGRKTKATNMTKTKASSSSRVYPVHKRRTLRTLMFTARGSMLRHAALSSRQSHFRFVEVEVSRGGFHKIKS